MFANQHLVFAKTHLLLSVGGSTLELIMACPEDDDDEDKNSVSTHDDYRRPQVTIAEFA